MAKHTFYSPCIDLMDDMKGCKKLLRDEEPCLKWVELGTEDDPYKYCREHTVCIETDTIDMFNGGNHETI